MGFFIYVSFFSYNQHFLHTMNYQASKNDRGTIAYPLHGKSVYILGNRRLQNELMAAFLERETGAKCLYIDDDNKILDIEVDDTDEEELKLFLLDCLGKDLDRCLDYLESHSKRMLSRHLVALFNVSEGLGIEQEAIVRGVRGFFYEHYTLERFLKGLRAIFDGALWFSGELMAKNIQGNKAKNRSIEIDKHNLTPREIEILTMVTEGAKNEEIAAKLFISSHTVKTHIYNIFQKINVPNRLQAAFWAIKNL